MRRSRATYRPTVTPVGSTHVDSFTGTTSSISSTDGADSSRVHRRPHGAAGSLLCLAEREPYVGAEDALVVAVVAPEPRLAASGRVMR